MSSDTALARMFGHDSWMRSVDRIREAYNRREFFEEPDRFFGRAGTIAGEEVGVRSFGRAGRVVDLRWSSRFAPLCTDVHESYYACRENRTAAARLFLHDDGARPAIILVHGYLGGAFPVEERAFPVRWLYQRGLNVALAVLPFHGVPRDHTLGRARGPIFPGSDPRITIEGFRQTIVDLRDLAGALRAHGSSAVGLMGMSLGGYSTALAATVMSDLAFAVPMIPLASIADFAREQRRFVGSPSEQRLQYEALDAAHAIVSPLARKPMVPSDRMLVLAAEGDRVTPIEHARRIAEHFDAPLETFAGGHLLQFGRGAAFRSVGRLLGGLGFFTRRSA